MRNLLNQIPIQKLFLCNEFDLRPFGLDAWCSMIVESKLVIYWNTPQGKERKAIQVTVPTYEMKHPEKLEATVWNMFTVFEYTKRESYNSTEIDWTRFKSRFIDACLELKRNCI